MQTENPVTNRIPFQVWAILILLNIGLIISVLNSQILNNKESKPGENSQVGAITSPTTTETQTIAASSTMASDENATPISTALFENENVYFLSINQTGIFHIYAFSPGNLDFTPLFDNKFEEIHPSLNPDKSRIAYIARKNGYWDLYIYDFASQSETRVTDSADYEGHPTWSPDGQYLAYETFDGQNLDIFVQTLDDLTQTPIRLTDGIEADFSPAWSPTGREIAFVSTRTGEPEIWVASLDSVENRFKNISHQPEKSNQDPAWSEDGTTLFWTIELDGYQLLQTYNRNDKNAIVQTFSEGNTANWAGNQVFYLQSDANRSFLSARSVNGEILLPPTSLPGSVDGYTIMPASEISRGLIERLKQSDTARKSLLKVTSSGLIGEASQAGLRKVEDIEAPFPYFLVGADTAFQSLREVTADSIGWDFLKNLTNAFVPITEPKAPENENDWSFTGRSFEFNPMTIYAGLAVVMREERGGQTFWHIYLKTRYQDGTQGRPLTSMPWKLDARYSNEPSTYENGGSLTEIPVGYWFDFTTLARAYGWERLAALSNWRTYFAGTRYNQFIFSNGLDWYTAMNTIYPAEALRSPTPLPSITITPSLTATIRYYRSPTATQIPTETPVPTRRPTWTVVP